MVLVSSLFVSFYEQVSAARGDGYLLYGQGATTQPRYRTWTDATNTLGAEVNGIAAAASIRHIIVKESPTRNELIAGIQTTGGVLYIQRWNGTAWSNEWNVTVGNNNLPRFDIAYERKSGRALVMYTGNVATTNELRYRTYDGTSWVGPTNFDPIRTTGIVDTVKLVSQKASNYIGVAWGDRNFDLSANFWDGDTSTFIGEPAAAFSTNLSKVGAATALTNYSFDIAFENTSNELMIAWGNDTVQDLSFATRGSGTGGAWSGVITDTAFFEEPTDIQLVSEPNSDYIAYANASDNGGDGDAGIWNGSAWGNRSNYDTSLDTVALGTKNVSGAWLINGAQSRFVLTYDDNNAAGVDWTVFNKNTPGWAVQTDFTTAPAPASNNDLVRRMYTNTFDLSEAMLVVVDGAQDLFFKKLTFNGTTLTWASVEPGGTSPENTVSVNNGLAADYAYSRYITPATLGVDLVDANGTAVGSPSIAFTTLLSSFSCQTSTATLGTASQKIRINNGTANELWTLSIAATGGITSNWTNGSTGQYDYNDPGGSGCTDGGDADSLAGQLTFDASSSTITNLFHDCDASGITKGALAGFVQGTTDAVTIANTSSAAIKNCDFDITGIDVSQEVPAERPTGNYTLNMTITVTAN
jgi:hypothetical protein